MSECRDWVNTQNKASYKDIFFEVDSEVREVGRRLVPHEYPSREWYDVEDMGRAMPVHLVQGYTHGDNADYQAELLMTACSSPGSGKLILPLAPTIDAYCRVAHRSFEADVMGRFSVDMEFIPVPQALGGLVSSVLHGTIVGKAVTSAIQILDASFQTNFNTLMRRFSPLREVPAVAREAAALTIALACDALNRARMNSVFTKPLNSALVGFAIRDIKQHRLDYAFHGQRAIAITDEHLVVDQQASKNNLATKFTDIFRKMIDSCTPDSLFHAFKDLSAFKGQTISTLVNARSVKAEIVLSGEIVQLIRRLAVIHLAEVITAITYKSREQLVTLRGDISVDIEEELTTVEETDVSDAMIAVQSAIVGYLSNAGAELPTSIIMHANVEMPAAVVAHMLYNDSSRDRELMIKNGVGHPLFLPFSFIAINPSSLP